MMTLVYIVFIFAAASALFVAMRRIRNDKIRKAAREKEWQEFEKEHPPKDFDSNPAKN